MIGAAGPPTRPARRRTRRRPAQPPSTETATSAAGSHGRRPRWSGVFATTSPTRGSTARRKNGARAARVSTGARCTWRAAGASPTLRRTGVTALRRGSETERTTRRCVSLVARRRGVATAAESAPAPRGSAARGADSSRRLDGLGRRGLGLDSRPTAAGAGGETSSSTGAGGGEIAGIVGGGAGGGAGDGDGTGAGGGGGSGAGACGAGRGASRPSGSTYPSSSAAIRMPRWTCGPGVSGSTLVPTLPTVSPSATNRPRSTSSAPSCARVTA